MYCSLVCVWGGGAGHGESVGYLRCSDCYLETCEDPLMRSSYCNTRVKTILIEAYLVFVGSNQSDLFSCICLSTERLWMNADMLTLAERECLLCFNMDVKLGVLS